MNKCHSMQIKPRINVLLNHRDDKGGLVHQGMVILADPDAPIAWLKRAITEKHQRLYPDVRNFQINRIQNELGNDLDDIDIIGEMLRDGDIVRLVLSQPAIVGSSHPSSTLTAILNTISSSPIPLSSHRKRRRSKERESTSIDIDEDGVTINGKTKSGGKFGQAKRRGRGRPRKPEYDDILVKLPENYYVPSPQNRDGIEPYMQNPKPGGISDRIPERQQQPLRENEARPELIPERKINKVNQPEQTQNVNTSQSSTEVIKDTQKYLLNNGLTGGKDIVNENTMSKLNMHPMTQLTPIRNLSLDKEESQLNQETHAPESVPINEQTRDKSLANKRISNALHDELDSDSSVLTDIESEGKEDGNVDSGDDEEEANDQFFASTAVNMEEHNHNLEKSVISASTKENISEGRSKDVGIKPNNILRSLEEKENVGESDDEINDEREDEKSHNDDEDSDSEESLDDSSDNEFTKDSKALPNTNGILAKITTNSDSESSNVSVISDKLQSPKIVTVAPIVAAKVPDLAEKNQINQFSDGQPLTPLTSTKGNQIHAINKEAGTETTNSPNVEDMRSESDSDSTAATSDDTKAGKLKVGDKKIDTISPSHSSKSRNENINPVTNSSNSKRLFTNPSKNNFTTLTELVATRKYIKGPSRTSSFVSKEESQEEEENESDRSSSTSEDSDSDAGTKPTGRNLPIAGVRKKQKRQNGLRALAMDAKKMRLGT